MLPEGARGQLKTRTRSLALLLGGAWVALSWALLGCEENDTPASPASGTESQPGEKAKEGAAPGIPREGTPLTAHFLTRAVEGIADQVPQDAEMIEIRARGTRLTIQMVSDRGVVVVHYQEPDTPTDGRLSAHPGRVTGPEQVPVYGDGSLEDNAFSWQDADVAKIARAFGVAQKAVDPADGWVRELVVRRYLPFGTGVRARIYVESPRMSGSIDTNGEGIPLKR